MDERLKLEVATIVIWHLAAIIISITIYMIFYMKANRTTAVKAFLYVQGTVILWMIAKILKTVSPTVDMRWGFIMLQYFAICLLEVAFLEFGYAYYSGKTFKIKTKMLLYVIPIIQFIIIVTNPSHYLFYKKYTFYGDSFGVLFYIHFAIEYIYIVIGFIFCGMKFKKQFTKGNKLYMYIITTGILVPIVLNLVYVSKILHDFFERLQLPVVFDITPIVFTWSLLLFAYATFKNEFLDLLPIMIHEITYMLDTPICVLDSTGDVVFTNGKFDLKFDYKRNPKKFKKFIKNERNRLISKKNDLSDDFSTEYYNEYYKIYSRPIKSITGTQYVIAFDNVSFYVSLKKQLVKENGELIIANKKLEKRIELLKQTSRISARNFIARELHDIIGHSLVVTIKLLEVVKLFFKKDKKMAIDALDKAKYSINNGFNEMKDVNSKKSEKNLYTGSLLESELDRILKDIELAGIKVNLYFRGTIKKIDEKKFDVIKKICKELSTNTLKHAEASRILISVVAKQDNIMISFMDNGMGQEKIVKGNGLKGIDSRIELVGGYVEYSTSLSEGFSANIYIPK